MGLVVVLVIWGGYSSVVVGWDRLQSGCGPIKPMLWPSKAPLAQLHQPCGGSAPSTTATATATATAPAPAASGSNLAGA